MGLEEEDGRNLPASGEHLHLKSARKNNTYLNTADHIQARTLLALKESPNHQKVPEAQAKATKKSGR